MASVRWTVGARADFREIVAYISQDSVTYAAAVAGRLVSNVDRLRHHPRLGRVVPEYRDQTIRELIVGNYRVAYRFHQRRVAILAIVHGSRDLLRRLPHGPWNLS